MKFGVEEIQQILGVPTFEFPGDLKEFDTIVIVSDHRIYLSTPDREIKSNMEQCRLILDNTELWKHIDFGPSIEYHVAGDINWLGDA